MYSINAETIELVGPVMVRLTALQSIKSRGCLVHKFSIGVNHGSIRVVSELLSCDDLCGNLTKSKIGSVLVSARHGVQTWLEFLTRPTTAKAPK